MKITSIYALLLTTFGLAGAHAQTPLVHEIEFNLSDWQTVFDLDYSFTLGEVSSIDSVTMEIANAASRDVAVYLISPDAPGQPSQDLSLTGGGTGAVSDFFGSGQNGYSLADVQPYEIIWKNDPNVDTTGISFLATSSFNTDGSLTPDTYKVSGWIQPPGNDPWESGQWQLDFRDNEAINAAPLGALGKVTINYHGAPEPSAAFLLLGGLSLLGLRRRR